MAGLSYRPDILPSVRLCCLLLVCLLLVAALQRGASPLVHIPHQGSPVVTIPSLPGNNENNKNNNASQSQALEAPHYRICQSQELHLITMIGSMMDYVISLCSTMMSLNTTTLSLITASRMSLVTEVTV